MSRWALVTGAARGIGRAIADAFQRRGWQVIGWDRQPPVGPRPAWTFMAVDVADAAAVAASMDAVARHTPRLHALVNNAAVQLAKPLVATTPEEWDALMAVNLRGPFVVSRAAYPLLRAAGDAAVVHVASVHALATSANIAAYAASKGGLLALTRAMAIEWAPAGIRVNAVLPGAVDTAMLRAGLQRGHLQADAVEAQLAELARRTVLGRVGAPEDIAAAVLFLADPSQSAFMTGHGLVVDGGATIRLSTE